jgi:hypothetical protein
MNGPLVAPGSAGVTARPSGSPPLSRGQRLAFLGCSVAVGVFSAFNNFTLLLWLATFTGSYLLLGLLGNTRTFEGAIVSPLAGAWSDRTWLGWLGRRRPFVLAGGLASAALLALTPTLGRQSVPLDLDWLPGSVGALATTILTILLWPRAIFGLMAGMIAVALALLPFTQPPSNVVDDPACAPGPWPGKPRGESFDVHASL